MQFKDWLISEVKQFTGLTPDTIDWWARYAQHKTFKSEAEARQWMFDRMEYADNQPHTAVFGGPDGPEYNKAVAAAMPLYQSGNSFKIGKRIRKKPLSWDDIDVRPNSLENLETAGYVNAFDGPRLSPVKLVPVSKIYKTESHTDKPAGQEWIWKLANMLKNGEGYFTAVVCNEDGSIIDGHHRYEAAQALKLRRVPVQYVLYDQE